MERCIKKHPFHSWSIYAAGKAYCSLEITTPKHFQLFYSFIKILARASINAGKVYFLYKLSYAFHLSSCCLVHLPMHGGKNSKRKEKTSMCYNSSCLLLCSFSTFSQFWRSLSWYQICVFSPLVVMLFIFVLYVYAYIFLYINRLSV